MTTDLVANSLGSGLQLELVVIMRLQVAASASAHLAFQRGTKYSETRVTALRFG